MASHRTAALTLALLLVAPGLALGLGHGHERARLAWVPARHTLVVERGHAVAVELRVRRGRGFRGRLTIDSWRLPRGTRAVWTLPRGGRLPRKRGDRLGVVLPARASRARLRIVTNRHTPLGRFRFRVSVLARHTHSRRWLVLAIVPQRRTTASQPPAAIDVGTDSGQRFSISALATSPLHPGLTVPVDLTLANPGPRPISITRLTVAVRDRTSQPGCRGSVNYSVRQFGGPYPLVVPPGTTTLAALRPDPAQWPQLTMLDLPVNQDACKGAAVTLEFAAEGTSA